MKSALHINYNGPSMKPLLRPGDGLVLDTRVPFASLRKGDVICFNSPEKPILVAHRIVALSPDGLITAGENNRVTDPYVVTPAQKPVLVTHVRRGRRTIKIHGGISGVMIFRINRIRYVLLLRFVHPTILRLKNLFGFLAENGRLGHLPILEKNLSVQRFRCDGEESLKLIYKQRHIGSRKADGSWWVKVPWRFFIRPERLSHPGEDGRPWS